MPETCIDVIRTLLEQADPDTRRRLLNARVEQPNRLIVSGTPLWMAVASGHKEVVDYFLSLPETVKVDSEVARGLLQTLATAKQTPELITSFVAVFNAFPNEVAHNIMLNTDYSPIPWCFYDQEILSTLLQKLSSRAGNRKTAQELFNVAINYDPLSSGPPSKNLPPYDEPGIISTLLIYRADPTAEGSLTSDVELVRAVTVRSSRIQKVFTELTKLHMDLERDAPYPEIPADAFVVLGKLIRHGGDQDHEVIWKAIAWMKVSRMEWRTLNAEMDAIEKEMQARSSPQPIKSQRRSMLFSSLRPTDKFSGLTSMPNETLQRNREVDWLLLKFIEGFETLIEVFRPILRTRQRAKPF